MRRDPLGVRAAAEAKPARETKRQHDPDRDRLAVQEAVGISGGGFEGVGEGVSEIEERALARFALVAADDRSIGAATRGDRMNALGTAREYGAPILFEPAEERRVVDQAVFGDFRVTGAEFAR